MIEKLSIYDPQIKQKLPKLFHFFFTFWKTDSFRGNLIIWWELYRKVNNPANSGWKKTWRVIIGLMQMAARNYESGENKNDRQTKFKCRPIQYYSNPLRNIRKTLRAWNPVPNIFNQQFYQRKVVFIELYVALFHFGFLAIHSIYHFVFLALQTKGNIFLLSNSINWLKKKKNNDKY